MSDVDNRIVNLTLNNGQLINGVRATLGVLAKLNSAINGTGGTGMEQLGGSVDSVSRRFSLMQVAGVTAIATIVNQAVMAGGQFAKSLTIAPLAEGFNEYNTKIEATQTAMANTGESVEKVTSKLNELNKYSDDTIYNFGQMAKNVGTFTAAGVDLDTSVDAIKGIANLAGLSGSSAEQAAGAMYQLSQGISAGKITLEDWNSVVNAGMGGKKFQTALARTAQNIGTIGKNSVGTTGAMKTLTINGESFRNSISAIGKEPWLTSDVMVETLKQFSGAYTEAELRAKGFSATNAKAIVKDAELAFNAATQIKTLPQLVSTVRESVGSIYGHAFETIIGNFDQAKNLFSKAGFALIGPSGVITRMGESFNGLIDGWAKAGGRQDLVDGLVNVWKALLAVIAPIKDAFREIFPAATVADLLAFTSSFKDFTQNLIIGSQTAENVKRTFAGVFAVFSIAKQVIGGILGVIGDLIGQLTGGAGGFLEFTGSIGDFLVSVDEALKKGKGLETFFNGLSNILSVPMGLLTGLGDILANLFGGGAGQLDLLANAGERVGNIWGGVTSLFQGIVNLLAPAIQAIGDGISSMMQSLAEGLGGEGVSTILDTFNTVFLGGIAAGIGLLLKNGLDLNLGGGVFSSISKSFDELTGVLSAMQTQIKANALVKIATAVAILAASMFVLSTIDSAGLTRALTAISAGFALLLGSMQVITMIGSPKMFAQMILFAQAMQMLAVAILILSTSVMLLSTLSWEELSKGLLGVAALLGMVVLLSKALEAQAKGMITSSVGIVLIALAIRILANAVQAMASMTWGEMIQGLVGVAAALGAIVLAMKLMPKTLAADALLIAAVGLSIGELAKGVAAFASLSWGEMVQGLVGLAGALVVIALAMQLMPPTMILTAVGLYIVAQALGAISTAVIAMSGMTWEEIGKGMVVLAGSLVILAAGLYLMSGTLAGAAALTIAAVALSLFIPVLQQMAELSWETIGTGLAKLAVVLVALSVAGLLMTPLVPVFLLLGAALALLGLGVALAGAGVLALSLGLTALVAVGSAGFGIIVGAIEQFLTVVPKIAVAMAEAAVAFLESIANMTPRVVVAMVKMIGAMLEGVNRLAPKFGNTMNIMMGVGLNVLARNVPRFIQFGFLVINAFLNAARARVPGIVNTAGDLISSFIRALGAQAGKIAQAGFDTIIKFIDSVSTAIDNNSSRLGAAGGRLAASIVNGMVNGLGSAATSAIASASANIANSIPDTVKKLLGIHSPSRVMHKLGKFTGQGFVNGLTSNFSKVRTASIRMALVATEAMSRSVAQLRLQADAQQARADAYEKHADRIEKAAQKKAKALEKKGDKKGAKAVEDRAEKQTKILEKLAKKAEARANSANARAERAEKREQFQEDFKEADSEGRADLLQKRAQESAQWAADQRERAIRLAYEADLLRKTDKKEAKRLDKAAKEARKASQTAANNARADMIRARAYMAKAVGVDITETRNYIKEQQLELTGGAKVSAKTAASAKKKGEDLLKTSQKQLAQADKLRKTDADRAQALADLAQTNAENAYKYLQQAKSEAETVKATQDSIKDVRAYIKGQQDQIARDAKFEAASSDEKAKILEAESKAADAEAKRLLALAQQQLNTADKLAATDAEGAAAIAEQAQANAQASFEAQKNAEDWAKEAKEWVEKAQTETGAGLSLISPQDIYAAQAAFDSYIHSLSAAEAAASTPPTIEYNQYNNSPEALSNSEIYRQTKNLVSIAEDKLVGV